MTVRATIQWGHGDSAVVDSMEAFEELLAKLEAGARHHPFMMTVIASDGRSLAVGLGRNEAVLSLTGPNGSLPYFASVGTEGTEGFISFEFGGESSGFPLRHAVPMQDARRAVEQFLCVPGLPGAVSWEEI
jgi:hypothetical protein